MQNDSKSMPPGVAARTNKYESANPRNLGILGAGALVLLMLALCSGVAHLTYKHWSEARPPDRARGSIIAPNLQPLNRFPSPRLQVDEHADLMVFLGRQQAELTNYGWIDRRTGVVRLPIDRAMDLMAQREAGAPTNAPPGPSPEELIQERPLWR